MAKQRYKAVKQWLYSIPKTEFALHNLKRALEEVEDKIAAPPPWAAKLDLARAIGDTYNSSVEYVVVDLPARRDFLRDCAARHERKLEQFWQTLDKMREMEERWGSLGAEIIRLKYYKRVKPDRLIYNGILYCSPETFYRTLNRALQFFYDVLPDVFSQQK